jgi:large subunit ribosomal protein L18
MKQILLKNKRRLRRRNSVRTRIRREASVPRLSIQRSVKHFYGQIIDDASGHTLAHVATTTRALRDDLTGKRKTEQAQFLGAELARKAREAGIERVVFDRGHSKYHGRVKAFAEAAREGGLKF